MPSSLRGKTVLLGITGGIAAYKAADLCSRLSKLGAQVWVLMTEGATKFISPLTLQTLSHNHVVVDIFEERDPAVVSHIDLADRADLVVVAPATANIIAKLAHGIADDMLSTTLLATRAPILIAPAMNVHMYAHWSVVQNMALLKAHGVRFVEPDEGLLACGYEGKGKLADPGRIIAEMEAILSPKRDWAGKTVLITSGATREPLDPVRYFTNRSSGKMGFAIAEAARDRGARVLLVKGAASAPLPDGVEVFPVETAQEMYDKVLELLPEADVIIKAAAVADYRPVQFSPQKMKKSGSGDQLTVVLEQTPDILAELGRRKAPHQCLVGFAAETEKVAEHARKKLERKGADYIVANDVSEEHAGFEVDTNRVLILGRDGFETEWPLLTKREVGERLLDLLRVRWMEKEKR